MKKLDRGGYEIVTALRDAGFSAFFAGGWVRDYIMGHPSSDIDIATDASPEQIVALFPRTIKVGMSFGVVIVNLHGHQYEVSTFRKDLEYLDGRRPEGFEPANPMEDAQRRDFTINGMFYDPIEDKVYDYVQGIKDIENKIIRCIGDPHERISEDRLRMVRAIRFASRFNFEIHPETEKAIQINSPTLLPAVSMERIWQEIGKMVLYPGYDQALIAMHRMGLLKVVFPNLRHLPTEELITKASITTFLPRHAPPIAYVMQLFPEVDEDEIESICRYLKTSNAEMKFALLMHDAKQLMSQEAHLDIKQRPSAIEWAKFYANIDSGTVLEVIAATDIKNKDAQDALHNAKKEKLQPYIQRIKERSPIVTAALLKSCGIVPGKEMGELLKEAERLAAENLLSDQEQVIQLLKASSLWPKGEKA